MKPMIRKGFFGDDERYVAIHADYIEQCLDEMRKKGIVNLAINNAWGWDSSRKNLNFLFENTWVEGVMIVSNNVDVGPINELHHLKGLSLPDKYTGVLNFRNFPQLELLFCRWNKKQLKYIEDATSLQSASIYWINEVDLSLLHNWKKLKTFDTVYSKIQSLHGIEHWDRLEKITLMKLPKLSDVSALDKLSDHIKDFSIEGCKSLTDYSFLKKLKALETIGIGEGPPIKSVEFLKELNLKSGFIGAEVLDKKLDVLDQKGIDYWKYKSYKS